MIRRGGTANPASLFPKYLQGTCQSWLCYRIAKDAYHITLIKHILIVDCFRLIGVQHIKRMVFTFSNKHLLSRLESVSFWRVDLCILDFKCI